MNRLLHYITGNHDHEPWYRGLTAPTEMGPNLVYVPRGVILDLDGRRVGFLGGGDSLVDRPQRREGIDWWPEERVSGEDVERFAGVGKVDVLVAHTPPALVYPLFGFRPDPSAVYVERVWEMLGRPVTVCGHLHRARALGSIRVLAPMEVLLL